MENVYFIKKKNTSIATLIKRYINKKSGKVVDSRNEIKRRFEYLDWKDQKKILFAFLESGKTDRQWAYLQLLGYWDKVFEPKVKELWEQFHEEKCSWVVIRHFPVEYITQNMGQFTGRNDYYFISIRLARDKSYVIDKNKLSVIQYLSVLYHSGRSIEPEEAEEMLYGAIHFICMIHPSKYAFGPLERYADVSVGSIIYPINFDYVNHVVYYLRKLNCRQVVKQFDEWNEMVGRKIADSPEFDMILNDGLTGDDYKQCMMNLSRLYAYLALDKKYKDPTDPPVEEMVNPPKDGYIYYSERDLKIKDLREKRGPSDPALLKEMITNNPYPSSG